MSKDHAVSESPLPQDYAPSATRATAGHVPVLQALLVANYDLTEAKAGLAVAHYEEHKALVALDAARLSGEIEICQAAGGEKALGPNEAAQKRAIAHQLERHDAYMAARRAHQEAVLDRRLAETDVALAEGQFQALLAALGRGILQVPVDWLLMPGEAHVGRPLAAAVIANGNAVAAPAPSRNGAKCAPAA